MKPISPAAPIKRIFIPSTVAFVITGLFTQAMAESTSLTIYSSAQPGSISPDMYRNGGAGMHVPG